MGEQPLNPKLSQGSWGRLEGTWGRGRGVGLRPPTTTNYLACLLRSVTLTLPRTRLRYNLGEGTPGEGR